MNLLRSTCQINISPPPPPPPSPEGPFELSFMFASQTPEAKYFQPGLVARMIINDSCTEDMPCSHTLHIVLKTGEDINLGDTWAPDILHLVEKYKDVVDIRTQSDKRPMDKMLKHLADTQEFESLCLFD